MEDWIRAVWFGKEVSAVLIVIRAGFNMVDVDGLIGPFNSSKGFCDRLLYRMKYCQEFRRR